MNGSLLVYKIKWMDLIQSIFFFYIFIIDEFSCRWTQQKIYKRIGLPPLIHMMLISIRLL